jgi:hypothetical protein
MPAACGFGLLGLGGYTSLEDGKRLLLEFGKLGLTPSFLEVIEARCYEVTHNKGRTELRELTGAAATQALAAWAAGRGADLDYDDWVALGDRQQVDIIVPGYASRWLKRDCASLHVNGTDEEPEEKWLLGTQDALKRVRKLDLPSRDWLEKALQTALDNRLLFTIAG